MGNVNRAKNMKSKKFKEKAIHRERNPTRNDIKEHGLNAPLLFYQKKKKKGTSAGPLLHLTLGNIRQEPGVFQMPTIQNNTIRSQSIYPCTVLNSRVLLRCKSAMALLSLLPSLCPLWPNLVRR